MYGLSHRKYTAGTLRPVEGMLANGETVKVQASTRRIKYRRVIELDHNLGKCQM